MEASRTNHEIVFGTTRAVVASGVVVGRNCSRQRLLVNRVRHLHSALGILSRGGKTDGKGFVNTIWKFPLKMIDDQFVQMPNGAQILTAQCQGEELCLWALVNPKAEKKPRHIEIFGTGHPVPKSMGVDRRYIGTAQQHNGILVWHVFERA